jgi:hypothetical protein
VLGDPRAGVLGDPRVGVLGDPEVGASAIFALGGVPRNRATIP